MTLMQHKKQFASCFSATSSVIDECGGLCSLMYVPWKQTGMQQEAICVHCRHMGVTESGSWYLNPVKTTGLRQLCSVIPFAPDAPSLHRVQGASGAQGMTEQSCRSLVVFTLQLLAMLPYSAAVSAVGVQEYPADAPLRVPILFASPWTAPPPAIAPNPAQPQPQQQSRSYAWRTPPCCQNVCLLTQPILERLRHALHR